MFRTVLFAYIFYNARLEFNNFFVIFTFIFSTPQKITGKPVLNEYFTELPVIEKVAKFAIPIHNPACAYGS